MSFPGVFMTFALTDFGIGHMFQTTLVAYSHNQIITSPTILPSVSLSRAQIRIEGLYIAEKCYG
jgi:hypothetical protein